MKRRLTQFCFALALLLMLAAGTLWARTLWVLDRFSLQRTWVEEQDTVVIEYLSVATRAASFELSWGRQEGWPHIHVRPVARESAPWRTFHHTYEPESFMAWRNTATTRWWERLGFACRLERMGYVTVPSWFLVLAPAVVAIPPLLSLLRDRRHRGRLRRGLCESCGYDLRGAEHEHCPECGAGVAVAAV